MHPEKQFRPGPDDGLCDTSCEAHCGGDATALCILLGQYRHAFMQDADPVGTTLPDHVLAQAYRYTRV